MRGFVEGLTPDYASLHPGYWLAHLILGQKTPRQAWRSQWYEEG